MSCNAASASIPVASASFAAGLSSDFKCRVSPGSISLRRNFLPSETRNGSARDFDLFMISLVFTVSELTIANRRPETCKEQRQSATHRGAPGPDSTRRRRVPGQRRELREDLKRHPCSACKPDATCPEAFRLTIRVAPGL